MTKQKGNFFASIFPMTAGCVALSAMILFKSSMKNMGKKKIENVDEEKEKSGSQPIYLDYNGTTPIHPQVTEAMLPYFTEHFGNPSSTHHYGKVPKLAIENARASVAKLVGGEDKGVTFTGCGTEADNLAIYLAIQSFLIQNSNNKINSIPHVITCCVEHPAVLEYLKNLEKQNKIKVTYLPVSSDCQVSASQVQAAIHPGETCLVTIMFAQNEIGSLMPIKQIIQICRQNNILFHTDAAQAVGKINLPQYFAIEGQSTSCLPDMITIVGHKFGAPKGIAALYIHPTNTNAEAMISNLKSSSASSFTSWGENGGLLIGGGQESGQRAGTENVPYIVGIGKASDIVMHQLQETSDRLEEHRTYLLNHLTELLKKEETPFDGEIFLVHGPSDPTQRLPNTLSIGIRNIQGGALLQKLGAEDVAASAGSACHSSSNSVSISAVLKEMKVPLEYAMGTLRLSVGISTTKAELQIAASKIAREVKAQWREQRAIRPSA